MLRKLMVLFFGGLVNTALFAAQVFSFVSFSMPDNLLEETLRESAQLNIPTYLNGLYRNSMQETALKVMSLSERVPNLNLQIDPTAFERFGVRQVPALVVESGKDFDVIYGHLSIKEGLSRMAGRGEADFSAQEFRRVVGE